MSLKTVYNLEIETLESGQRRRYGDSYYRYIVEDKGENALPGPVVEFFCRQFLKPAVKSRADQKCWADTYMTGFSKIGERKYEYTCVSPSTH